MPNDSDLHDDGHGELFFATRRRNIRRVGYVAIILAFVVPMVLAVWVFWDPIDRWIRGETDIFGEPTFSYQPVDDEVSGLEKIHASLLPGWIVAEANRDAWGVEQADKAFAELETSLASDPNLQKIVLEMKQILRAEEQVTQFERLIYLVRSWSNYLSEAGEPYLVQGNTVMTGQRSFFYIKSYEVEVDVDISVGDDAYRSRVVRRLDTTNVRESYLGATSKGADGAVVLVNRLYEFVLDDVVGILAGKPTTGWEAWSEPVRDELLQVLTDDNVAALEEAHAELERINTVYEAIEARRKCGNRLVIVKPGHAGLAPDTLADLQRWSTDDPLDMCPSLTSEELDELRDASQSLRQNEAYQRALGALIAVVSKGIAVHEARHVADDVRHNGLEEPLPCTICGPRDRAPTRAELSAYLASFAWGPTPKTTFFQACTATDGRGGPHARAMRHILTGLAHACADGPPQNLQERARELETEWFGRSERASVPEDYPRILDLTGVKR